MANESTIQTGLRIRKSSGAITLLDANYSGGYSVDVAGTKGPTPGSITITTEGEQISLSELTSAGWCWVHNQSPDYKVTIGIREPDTGRFYPLLDFLPGMRYPLYLSEDVGQEYTGTGTGTGVANAQLWVKAFGGAANVLIGAFQR